MVITRVTEFALSGSVIARPAVTGPAVSGPPITVDPAVAAGPALTRLDRLCQPEQQESLQQGQHQPE